MISNPVLVIGSRGFLGGAVARQLVADGQGVVGVDVAPVRLPGRLRATGGREFTGDARDARVLHLLATTARTRAIINAAGVNLPTWLNDRAAGRQANVDLPAIVADVARQHRLPLVHVSCTSVYGRPDLTVVKESTSPAPETTFARQLLLAEQVLGERTA